MKEKKFWESATKLVLLILTIGVLAAPFLGIKLPGELYTGWMLVLGFYFGSKQAKKVIPVKPELPDLDA